MKKIFTKSLCALLFFLFFISSQSKAQTGQALSFAPNQFATLPSDILAGIGTGNFTIEAWVYWRGGGDWQRVFDIGSGTNSYIYLSVSANLSGLGPQEIAFGFKIPGQVERRVTSGGVSMPVNVWTHLAVTVDYAIPAQPAARLYVNGTVTSNSPQEMSNLAGTPYTVTALGATTNNWLGRSQFPDPYFNGVIEEFRVSNTLQYTANFVPANTLSTTGATALYHFQDPSTSQTAANSASSGIGSITLGSTTAVEASDPTFLAIYPLPVYLLTFTLQKANNTITLKWTASVTGDGGRFIIERSFDGSNFKSIGSVNIPGGSGTFNYAYSDQSYGSGKNYYRLRIEENNTTPKYSSILEVNASGKGLYNAYPTATTSKIFIQIPQATTIAIYSSGGMLMKRVKLATSQNVDVNTLGKGMYQIIFEGSGETIQFVKL